MFKNKWFPVLILFSWLFISNSYSQTIISNGYNKNAGKTYAYDEGNVEILNGHVKQVTSFYEWHIDNWVRDTTNFDRNGNQTEEATGDNFMRRRVKYFYKYDKNARKTEITSNVYKSKGIYSYNNQGFTIKVMYNPSDTSSEFAIFNYNKKGYLIEKDHFFKPNLLFDITKYKYDHNDRLIETEQRSQKGILELRQTFKYPALDSMNNWTTIESHSEGFYTVPRDIQVHISKRTISYY